MSLKCKYFGHDFVPYRHRWVEFIPNSNKPNINRDGVYTLIQVYCKRCGLVREVSNESGDRIKYREFNP